MSKKPTVRIGRQKVTIEAPLDVTAAELTDALAEARKGIRAGTRRPDVRRRIAEMLELRSQGLTWDAVGDKMGVQPTQIRRWRYLLLEHVPKRYAVPADQRHELTEAELEQPSALVYESGAAVLADLLAHEARMRRRGHT